MAQSSAARLLAVLLVVALCASGGAASFGFQVAVKEIKAAPSSASSTTNKAVIYLGLPLDYTGSWPVGGQLEHAAIMALETVEKLPTLLPGVDLRLLATNSRCESSSDDTVGLFSSLIDIDGRAGGPPLVGSIGPLCTAGMVSLLGAATTVGLNVLNGCVNAPQLSDKVQYPYFLRTSGNDLKSMSGIVALAARVGWQTFGVRLH